MHDQEIRVHNCLDGVLAGDLSHYFDFTEVGTLLEAFVAEFVLAVDVVDSPGLNEVDLVGVFVLDANHITRFNQLRLQKRYNRTNKHRILPYKIRQCFCRAFMHCKRNFVPQRFWELVENILLVSPGESGFLSAVL